MDKEPAAIVGTVTAIVSAVLVFLDQFGVSLTDGQQDAIRGLVAVLAPLVAGLVIRSFVTPTPKALDRIDTAWLADPSRDPKPVL